MWAYVLPKKEKKRMKAREREEGIREYCSIKKQSYKLPSKWITEIWHSRPKPKWANVLDSWHKWHLGLNPIVRALALGLTHQT